MQAQAVVLPFVPVGVTCNMSYQSIGKSWTATFLSASRQGTFFLPAIFLLPKFLGIFGIQIAQAVADICTFLLGIPFAFYFYRFLKEKEYEFKRNQ